MLTSARAKAVALVATIGATMLAVGSIAAGQVAPAAHASGQLTVFAAASLTKVFPQIDSGAKYSFGGSGTLETEIQQGAPADVFAAASPKQTTALYTAGLAYKPVQFATNTLVMIVPRDNPAHIRSVYDVTKPGVKIVVCNATVPCGDYATTAWANLGITAGAMKNVVSEQTDVTQVVAQIAAGQGDVGFVYITDAKAAGAKVTAIGLPAKAKPGTQDTISIVKGTKNPAAARAFLALVLSRKGQAILKAAGFGKP